jgi:uncharacterized membrane protein (DUF485 family)
MYKGMSWFLVFSPVITYISLIGFLFMCVAFGVLVKIFVIKAIREVEREKNDNKANNIS